MAHGAELEDAVALLFLDGGADELVHVGGLALLVEVLEMDHRGAAGVLLDVGGGILAGDLHPAGVHLGLEQVGGDGVVDVVQGVAAVGHLHELKVVVVIERLDAVGLAGLADLLEELHVPLKLGGAGTVLFHQVGDGDELHADLHVLLDGAFHVGHQLLEGHVGGQGHQAGVLNGGFDLAGLFAVQAGQLYAFVADLFDLFHGAGEILFGVFPNGIDLHRDGQCFHGKYLQSKSDLSLNDISVLPKGQGVSGKNLHEFLAFAPDPSGFSPV